MSPWIRCRRPSAAAIGSPGRIGVISRTSPLSCRPLAILPSISCSFAAKPEPVRAPGLAVVAFDTLEHVPTARREAFLDEQCRDDPHLRREVDELLAVDDEGREILSTGGTAKQLREAGIDAIEYPLQVDGVVGEVVTQVVQYER